MATPLPFRGHRDLTPVEFSDLLADIEWCVEWDNDGVLMTEGFATAAERIFRERGLKVVKVVEGPG